MATTEMVKRELTKIVKRQIKEEGREEGLKKSILNILSKGYSVESTADLLACSVEFVKSTKAEADLKIEILSLLKAEKSISFIAEQLKIEETYVLEVENEFNQE